MKAAKLVLMLSSAIALTACGTKLPASANGECVVFEAPQEVVTGKTRRDQFWIDKTVEAGTLTRAALAADKKLITGVSVFDVFEGAALGPDKKSIAIEVSIQPVDRTLTDEDFEALAGRIVENVKKQTGGTLRG